MLNDSKDMRFGIELSGIAERTRERLRQAEARKMISDLQTVKIALKQILEAQTAGVAEKQQEQVDTNKKFEAFSAQQNENLAALLEVRKELAAMRLENRDLSTKLDTLNQKVTQLSMPAKSGKSARIVWQSFATWMAQKLVKIFFDKAIALLLEGGVPMAIFVFLMHLIKVMQTKEQFGAFSWFSALISYLINGKIGYFGI